MKNSTFFAIFIPILSVIVTTIFTTVYARRQPVDPKLLRMGYMIAAAGIVLLIIFLV